MIQCCFVPLKQNRIELTSFHRSFAGWAKDDCGSKVPSTQIAICVQGYRACHNRNTIFTLNTKINA